MMAYTVRFSAGLLAAGLLAGACTTPGAAEETPPAAEARLGPARQAERPPDDTLRLSLDAAIARARDANPGLRSVAERARSADRRAAAVFRQHFGTVEGVAWGTRYQDAQVLRPIAQNLLNGGIGGMPFAQDQLHYGLTFELPLFVGGKLIAGGHLARLQADEAKALVEGTRWQVRANVITLYSANQALEAATRAYEDQVTALEETYRRLTLMVREGKRPDVDLLKVSETLEEARAQLAGARADRTRVGALLAAVLDYPTDRAFSLDPLPDSFPALPDEPQDWHALVERASALVTARLRAAEATSGKHVARAEFLPSLSLRGNVLEHAASNVDDTQQTWELTLGASIPLFTGGRRVAAYRSAAAAERSARLALEQERLRQDAEIEGALARFRAERVRLAAARRRVAAADEAARVENIRYESGAGTIEDLLRARTRAAAAQAGLARTKGDVLGAAARINALVEREVVR